MRRRLAAVALVMVTIGAILPAQAKRSLQSGQMILPGAAVNTQASSKLSVANINRSLNVGAGTSIQENSPVDSQVDPASIYALNANKRLHGMSGPGIATVNGTNSMTFFMEMIQRRKAARQEFLQQYGKSSYNTEYGAAHNSSFVHPNWQGSPVSQSINSTQLQVQQPALPARTKTYAPVR